MEFHQAEAPVLRRAAALLLHWSRRDLVAFSGVLNQVRDTGDAKDTIIAMALLAHMDPGDLQDVAIIGALREQGIEFP